MKRLPSHTFPVEIASSLSSPPTSSPWLPTPGALSYAVHYAPHRRCPPPVLTRGAVGLRGHAGHPTGGTWRPVVSPMTGQARLTGTRNEPGTHPCRHAMTSPATVLGQRPGVDGVTVGHSGRRGSAIVPGHPEPKDRELPRTWDRAWEPSSGRAGGDGLAAGSGELFGPGRSSHLLGCAAGLTGEDGGESVRGPGLGLAAADRTEGVRGCPCVLGDVHEVEQDMNVDAAAGGFVLDQVELVAGAVDEHDPVPQMLRVAGCGLGEGAGDDLFRGMDHGGGAPFPLRFRARPGRSASRVPPGASAFPGCPPSSRSSSAARSAARSAWPAPALAHP